MDDCTAGYIPLVVDAPDPRRVRFETVNDGFVRPVKNHISDSANLPFPALDVEARHILLDRASITLAFGPISSTAFPQPL